MGAKCDGTAKVRLWRDWSVDNFDAVEIRRCSSRHSTDIAAIYPDVDTSEICCLVRDEITPTLLINAALPYGWLGSRVVSVLDSGAEGPEFKSSRDAVG